jgi:hypothetical protein
MLEVNEVHVNVSSPDCKTKSLYKDNVANFKNLEKAVTNQICIHEEITRTLNSGSACYHAVQNLLSPLLLPKNVKIKIYKTTFYLLFCMGVKPGLSR